MAELEQQTAEFAAILETLGAEDRATMYRLSYLDRAFPKFGAEFMARYNAGEIKGLEELARFIDAWLEAHSLTALFPPKRAALVQTGGGEG